MRLARIPTRVAQGGIAVGLVLSMGAVAVSAEAEEPVATSVVDGSSLARAAAARASTAYTEQLRAQAVEAAQTVIDDASRVRSDAAAAAVSEEALAELDAATAELQRVMQDVDVTSVDRSRNVSRNAERGELELPTQPEAATEPEAATGSEAATAPEAATDPAAAPAQEVEADPAAAPDAAAPDAPAADAATPDAPTEPASPGDRLAEVTLPDAADPVTTPLREALDRVKQAAEVVHATTEQRRAEAAAAQAAAEEAARVEAEKAAQRAAWKASLQGYSNGQIPSSALCAPSFDGSALLRCDAAESLDALSAAFHARFGSHLDVSDSYRSYSAQVACRANKGSLCAAPGTSNHGLGVAVDLGGGVQSFGTAQHEWMRQHAPAHQWTLPDWARAGGSKPEPWHWEYVG